MVEPLIDRFSPDDINQLADDIRRGDVDPELEAQIRERVEQTDDEAFRTALRVADDTSAYVRAFNGLLEVLDLAPIQLDVATVREFLANRSADEIEALADAIRDGDARRGQIDTLQELFGQTRTERIQELVEDTEDPFVYAGAMSVLLGALNLDQIEPPSAAPVSPDDIDDDVELEERSEEEVEAAEEIRRLTQNYDTDQLADLEAALRQNDPQRAPDALSRSLLSTVDRGQQEQLAAEIRDLLPDDDPDGDPTAFIEEAEPDRPQASGAAPSATDEDFQDVYPLISEVVASGGGRDEAYFRRVRNVVTGTRDPREWAQGRDVPTDQLAEEVGDLRSEPSVRDDVIELLDRRIQGSGRAGPPGGTAAGGVTGGGAAVGGGGVAGPPQAEGDTEQLQRIADRTVTRFDVTERPPPSTSSESLRERYPQPMKRQAYVRFESGRLGQVDPLPVAEYYELQTEQMEKAKLSRVEWLTGQERRFIDLDESDIG